MIAILDFGSQYNQLIARRVRECRVYCEILPHDISPSELKAKEPQRDNPLRGAGQHF